MNSEHLDCCHYKTTQKTRIQKVNKKPNIRYKKDYDQHTANPSCHLRPLRPNYHPQPVLLRSTPRTMFLPKSDIPSFPPIQNNRRRQSSVLSESHHTADIRQDHTVLLQAVPTPLNLVTFYVCAGCTQIECYNSSLQGRYAVPIHQYLPTFQTAVPPTKRQ